MLSLAASMLLHGAVVQVWQSWQAGQGSVTGRSGVSVFLANAQPGQVVPEAPPSPQLKTQHPLDLPVLAPEIRRRESATAFTNESDRDAGVASTPATSADVITSTTVSREPKALKSESKELKVEPEHISELGKNEMGANVSESALQEPAYVMGSAQNPRPEYPFVARKFAWEGLVRIGVNVAASGWPEQVEVLQSSGRNVLDQAALQTIRDEWLFQPARKVGVAVPSYIVVPVQFALHD